MSSAKPAQLVGTPTRFRLRGLRRVPIRSGTALEIRAEVFNATNTPGFGNPQGVFGTPGFGSITSAGDPRVIQLALKFPVLKSVSRTSNVVLRRSTL